MAMSARELLLIIRAQNQASAALRRVAGDMKGLGRIQDLNLRRNQLAINQANTIRQQMRAEAALADVTSGRRRMLAERERLTLLNKEARLQENIKTATERRRIVQGRMNILTALGAKKESLTMKNLETQRRAHTRSIRHYRRQLDLIPASLEAQTARMKNLNDQASRLRGELRTLAQRSVLTDEKMRILNKEISAARWDKAVFGARAFAHAGRVMQLVGLGAGASLGFLANMAADFEQRAVLVATQTGRVGSGFEQIIQNSKVLSSSILKTMSDSTSSMEQVEAAAYDIFSSLTLPDGGKGLKVGSDMLKLLSDAAIAGMTDIETVGEGVIATLGAFEELPRTAGGVETILNRMFAAVRFGRMTFAEFASTLGTTAPAARAAGQTLDTMAGTIAFLSRPLGVNKAAVGFARLTEILGRKKFVDNLKEAGVNITDASGRMKQMPDVIDALTRKFPKLTKGGVALTQFFKEMSGTEGTIQARRAFVFLAQQMDQYRTVLGQTTKDNNEFDRSLKAMSETSAVQWKKAMNNLRTLGIEIGLAVIPTLVQMLEPLEDLVHWFQELDPEVKDQIGRWAAWGAALLLVGGTLALIVGTVGSIIFQLMRMQILFRTVTIGVVAAAAAIALLTGNMELLEDIGSRVMDFFTGSWEGFIVGAALAAATIVKLTSAYKSLAATQALVSSASAAGVIGPQGFLPMIMRAPGNLRAYGSAVREAGKGTSMAGKAFKMAAGAALLMPGPLKLAAVGIAAFGVGALIWKARADAMKKEADELAASMKKVTDEINGAVAAARTFAGFGTSIMNFKRAQLDVADYNAQLRELRKQLKGAKGEERAAISRQIQRTILDRASALGVMRTATGEATKALRSFNDFMGKQAIIMDDVARKEARVREIHAKMAEITEGMPEGFIPGGSVKEMENLQKELSQINNELAVLREGSEIAGQGMAQSFEKVVRDLQDMGELPRKISKDAIADALALQVKMGRVLTRQEMRMVFKAAIDPKSMAQLPAEIRRFLRGRKQDRVQVTAEIKMARKKLTLGESVEQARRGVDFPAQLNSEKAKRQAQQLIGWFKANSTLPPFKASIAPSGVSMGQQLAQGIVSGFGSVNLSVHLTGIMDKTLRDAKANEDIQSPSGRWAREVGMPIGQGVLMGMIESFAQISPEIKKGSKEWKREMVRAWKEIIKTAGQTLLDHYNEFRDTLRDVFYDPINELNEMRMEWGEVLNVPELTASLREQTANLRQFSSNWARLVRRGAPLEMLLQLQEMGEEGVAIMNALAGASGPELKAYIKAWKAAQKQLDKVAKQQLQTELKRYKKLGKAMAFGIIAGLKDEQQRLINFFEKVFRNLFKNAQRNNRSNSPSKLYAEEGRNIIAGLQMGLAEGNNLMLPQPMIGGGLRRGRSIRTGGGNQINMTVNATHSESLMTTLERAKFRLKHR